jgi:hypothetical protein
MIGASDGKQYETPFDVSLGRPIPPEDSAVGAPRKPAGASKQQAPSTPSPAPVIDREHDVPLAASALHKDGDMYGIAIDKDAPIRPEYDQYIYKHEADEFAYMKDLIKNGMQPGEAYHKAHDHITPMESARVQADLGEKGLEDYKQYWRDVASHSTMKAKLASNDNSMPILKPLQPGEWGTPAEVTESAKAHKLDPKNTFRDSIKLKHPDMNEQEIDNYLESIPQSRLDRHPDAHTTTYGLDEKELGKKFASNKYGEGGKESGPYTPDPSKPGWILNDPNLRMPDDWDQIETRDPNKSDLRLHYPKGDDEPLVGGLQSNTQLAMNTPYPANDNLPPHNPMRQFDESQELLKRLFSQEKGKGDVLPFKPK